MDRLSFCVAVLIMSTHCKHLFVDEFYGQSSDTQYPRHLPHLLSAYAHASHAMRSLTRTRLCPTTPPVFRVLSMLATSRLGIFLRFHDLFSCVLILIACVWP